MEKTALIYIFAFNIQIHLKKNLLWGIDNPAKVIYIRTAKVSFTAGRTTDNFLRTNCTKDKNVTNVFNSPISILLVFTSIWVFKRRASGYDKTNEYD